MSKFNKSYRIRTEVGKDTQVHVNLDRDYDVLEIMSLKINQENAYKFHTSNYGVIAGRVLANDAFGIPNAKVSVFIQIDDNDKMDVVKSVLYPYNNTQSQNEDGIRYNLLPDEQLNDCHTIIGTFPEKQYLLDNDNILEVFDKYYKFTTRTNNAGDYMIFGVPTGSQTIHVDIDLSDIGILSQKPRDMYYKGYNIESFENPNKFKHDTNLDSLVQVVSQNNIANVIPFWGEEDEGSIGITRCDISVQYKFEPTCVFMGSVVSDTNSNGISKKCIPTPGMGSMEEIVTGSGTIEMIRKTPGGSVEEFQIKGNQLIDGNGVWCYQIPMNLDYMMTDEFGNMVPTNHPDKGVPTRTRVRFRVSLQDFDNDNENLARGKILIPHNPNIYNGSVNSEEEIDYNFGTKTKEESYRDLFWNGVYSVKSYIPRIQKGANWKNEKFTGFKRVNYYGDNNPIPYNNIRIRIPFAFTIMCVLIKTMIRTAAFLNWLFRICSISFVSVEDDDGNKKSGSFISISGELCNDNLDYLCIIPGVNIKSIAENDGKRRKTLLGGTILKHAEELGADLGKLESWTDNSSSYQDHQSIDYNNREDIATKSKELNNIVYDETQEVDVEAEDDGKKAGKEYKITIRGIRVTDKIDYFLQCIEMKLAQEFKVIQFDFYNDWINGMIYIPRWMRIITKKHNYLWGLIKWGGKVKACNDSRPNKKINIVQQCGLSYSNKSTENMQVINPIGCKETKNNEKLYCHKSKKVRKTYRIFQQSGLVHSFQNMNNQYIYYFKPIDNNSSKCVRLFATDIILLGTLNECDRWGIPGNLTELVSSTYQMPPNLALTDSDLEGNDYETKLSSDKKIYMDINVNKGRANSISIKECYVGINPLEEDANYTELSGIDWGYAGPLQTNDITGVTPTKLYKPGGHFLGITCRNAETTIKSCVNLSRICEYGVWMSQRQELNIPSPIAPNKQSSAFLNYATVPTGFISKDEISDTNYRRLFASLNQNKLRTRINPETGYPIYDFKYVNPTNFGGELKNKYTSSTTNADSKYMNRKITDLTTEHYYEYLDDDYYQRGDEETVSITKETQIMRTGEFSDSEYLKYRFGLTDDDFNSNGIFKLPSRENRFLLSSNNELSFPMFENSFYFYFGLKSGNTALDEFKKNYYANCSKVDLYSQSDDDISLIGLSSTYDGFEYNNSGNGTIYYSKLSASQELLDDGITIEIYDSNENMVRSEIVYSSSAYEFKNLVADDYKLKLISPNSGIEKEFAISVGRISFKINVVGTAFKEDVSTWSNTKRFNTYDNRVNLGGYLTITGNIIEYKKGVNETVLLNVFDSNVISKYRIKSIDNNIEVEGTGTTVTYNRITKTLTTDYDGNYMIPVPKDGDEYIIEVEGYVSLKDNKPNESGSSSTYTKTFVKSSGVSVPNGNVFDFYYNGVSFKREIMPYLVPGTDEESTDGWWSKKTSDNNLRLQWDAENSDITRWNIKNALYISEINNVNKPHTIKVSVYGGNAPYNITLKGENEDLTTSFETSELSQLESITIPTINYHKNGFRRKNFSYNVSDSIGQKLPSTNKKWFIIPVIYKPFFMEMALCNYEEHGVYLCGNIYNGKTWKEDEGFNNSALNGQRLQSFTTTIPDTTLMLDEIDSDGKKHTGGGLSYTGILQKYNGRKITIGRALNTLDIYGINTDGNIISCDLNIGTSHAHNSVLYEDSTSIKNTNMALYQFIVDSKTANNTYKFKMDVRTGGDAVNYKIYSIIDDSATIIENGETKINKGCYPYPFNETTGRPTLQNTLLFRHIIEDKLESLFDGDGTGGSNEIDINDTRLNSRNVYYVAIPNDFGTSSINTTNSNNMLKSVSISKLIDVKTLKHFYPLNLEANSNLCTDILNEDGTYTTTIILKGKDNDSWNNIAGKLFKLRFYENNKDNNVIYEVTVSPNNNREIEWKPTIEERAKLGIRNNEETNSGEVTNIYMDYEVTMISTNITSPSYYSRIEIPITFKNNLRSLN